VDDDVFQDPQVAPVREVFTSGRNDPRGRRRAKSIEEAEAVNSSNL
jgi:hypothetical protein